MPTRPRLRCADRLLWVLLSQLWPNWRGAIQMVTPETVVRWHRRGFALYCWWKARPRRAGRPAVAADIHALIRQMHAANPLWGAPRIHGELQKLGLTLSETTVAKYLGRRRCPPSPTWRTFLTTTLLNSPPWTSSPSLPPRFGCCLCSWCCRMTADASSTST